jgi:hypothetical protein
VRCEVRLAETASRAFAIARTRMLFRLGLAPQPIRPARNWRGNNYLGRYPATKLERHRPADVAAPRRLVAEVAAVPPEDR